MNGPTDPGATRLCPSCGAANVGGQASCLVCGRPLDAPASACPRCGQAVTPGDAFCGVCGQPLAPQPPTAAAPGPPTVSAPAALPPPARRVSLRSVLPIVSIVVGLATAGLGLTRLASSDEGTPSQPPPLATSPSVETTESDTPPGTLDVAQWPACSNNPGGYELQYPNDWFTFAARARDACSFFSPVPFEYERGTEDPGTPLQIHLLNVAFDDWVESYEQAGTEILSRGDTTVGGSRAVRLEYRFTDAPEAGTISEYLIEHPGGTLIAEAHETYAPDYEVAKQDLDLMMGTVTFA